MVAILFWCSLIFSYDLSYSLIRPISSPYSGSSIGKETLSDRSVIDQRAIANRSQIDQESIADRSAIAANRSAIAGDRFAIDL